MAKRRRKSIKVEFRLPEVIIQHIQSFLSGKQAARSSILSKSWYNAWSTRPDLDFDEREFLVEVKNRRSKVDGFWAIAKKTVQRYEELRLSIESFRLYFDRNFYCDLLAGELIVKVMKLGVLDFDIGIMRRDNLFNLFNLPCEVFESKTLIRLSVCGCKIELGEDRLVECKELKCLSLDRVWLGKDVLRDIIGSCPLIEKLTLLQSWCSWQVSYTKLGELYNLKTLFLGGVDVDPLFFINFSSRFPCLKDLSLHNCGGYNYRGIQLSSSSLECISFEQKRLLRADFDVPSIREFKFSGSSWPSLLFKTPSGEWTSDISVKCSRPSTAWFLKLKILLTCLSSSKISLSLDIVSIVKKGVSFKGFPRTEVENLTIHAPSSACSKVLECLFRCSCPKIITLHLLPESGQSGSIQKVNNRLMEILCKNPVKGVKEYRSIINQNKFGFHDLEEVRVEFFQENLAKWKPLTCWKTWFDASYEDQKMRTLRFKLRWGRGQ